MYEAQSNYEKYEIFSGPREGSYRLDGMTFK